MSSLLWNLNMQGLFIDRGNVQGYKYTIFAKRPCMSTEWSKITFGKQLEIEAQKLILLSLIPPKALVNELDTLETTFCARLFLLKFSIKFYIRILFYILSLSHWREYIIYILYKEGEVVNHDYFFLIWHVSGFQSVKCYVGVEPEGERWKACDLHRGMRTCYTKYDMCK